MKLILFIIIYMFYTLAYDTLYLYLFDIFYIQSLYSACMDLLEYNNTNTDRTLNHFFRQIQSYLREFAFLYKCFSSNHS